jgi:hypothetical protein
MNNSKPSWKEKEKKDRFLLQDLLKKTKIIGPRSLKIRRTPELEAGLQKARTLSGRHHHLQNQFHNWFLENMPMSDIDYERAFRSLQQALYGNKDGNQESHDELNTDFDPSGFGGTGGEDSPFDGEVRQPNRSNAFGIQEILRETEKAWLIKLDNGWEGWLPKSQCPLSADKAKVTIPNWLIAEKGLEDF